MTGAPDPHAVALRDRVRVTDLRGDVCTGVVDRVHGGGLYRVVFESCRHGDNWADVSADEIEPEAAP